MVANIQQAKDNVFEHSQAKLEFYKNYLAKYLIVLLNDPYTETINIYDVFCGIGIYDDGNEGSPIIAMNIIKDLKEQYPTKNISLTINDKDKTKVDFVSSYINDNYTNICNVEHHNLDADKMLQIVKSSIINQSRKTKNLIFIDPYGYKEIYKNDICEIMDSNNSEIIIFLPIAQMYRFSNVALTDEENNSYNHLRRLIKDFFDDSHPIQNESFDSQMKYIDYIKDAFNCDDKYYSASYSIQRDNRNYYALFFITSHIYGLDRIVETKWKLDSNCGKGFKQKQEVHLFSDYDEEQEKEDCLADLEKSLKIFLQSNKSNLEIYEFVLKSGYLPKQASEVLKQLNDGLEFDRDVRKNSFYISWKYYKNKDIKYKVKIIEQ
jgi:three-Cys-motif partner protein